eukprot:m.144196 g.144196  ORF g.144196 m.144196 type:complete len:1035 (+) comp10059_c0_seq1:102-3206(+)
MANHANVAGFMQSALVQWLKTLKPDGPPCETVDQLADGLLMNTFMADMDSFFEPNLKDIREDAHLDSRSRQHNLGLLIESMTVYYQEVLQTVVIMELPIISAICRDPGSAEGIEALKKCMMLMLGCSVQCANREMYINHIKSMSSEQQIEMMELIQDVMNGLIRVPWETMEQMSASSLLEQCRTAYEHLNRAVAERDVYAQKLDDARQERDFLAAQAVDETQIASPVGKPRTDSGEPQSSARHYDTVRELKMRLRNLSDELDQQTMAFEELVAENQEKKQQVSQLSLKLRQLQLVADDARQLRDDLEIWKAKAMENERNQIELQRCKEKLEDLEYTNARVEELKEQNALLQQQNEKLKEAHTSSDLTAHKLAAAEKENRLLQVQIEELLAAQENHFNKFRELNADKVRLESEKSHAQREIETLKQEAEALLISSREAGPTLSDETDAVTRSEMVVVEQELQQQRAKVAQLKERLLDYDVTKQQNEILTREKAEQAADLERLQVQFKELQDERNSLRTQYQEVNATLQEERIQNQQAVSDEKKRMMALESKIGTALTRSVELKEERIRVLEERLEDALNQNTQLKEDVLVYKKHNELLRQSASQQPYVILNSSRSSNPGTPRPSLPNTPASQSSVDAALQDQELRHAKEQIARLETEIESLHSVLRSDAPHAQKQLEAISEKNEALTHLNATLTEELERARFDLKRLEGSHNKSKEKEVQLYERIKILSQFKETLEKENKTLMAQLNKLLLQNQELLFQAINHKDRIKELSSQDHAASTTSVVSADNVSVSSKASESEVEVQGAKDNKAHAKRKGFRSTILRRVWRKDHHRRGDGTDGEAIPENERHNSISSGDLGPPVESPMRSSSSTPQNITSPGSECMGVEQFLLATKLPPSAFTKSPTVKGSRALKAGEPVVTASAPVKQEMSEKTMTALDFFLQEPPPPKAKQGMTLGNRTGRDPTWNAPSAEPVKRSSLSKAKTSRHELEPPRTLKLDNSVGCSSTDSPTLAGHTPARRSRPSASSSSRLQFDDNVELV